MGYIFVSYSRHDSERLDGLTDILVAAGYTVWIDRRAIPGGSLWREEIADAIERADLFLLLLSPHSVESVQVRKELDIAEEAKRPILPIEIQTTTIPQHMKYQLTGLQRINLVLNWDDGVTRLLDTLRKGGEAKTSDQMGIDEEGRTKLQSILADPTLSSSEKMVRHLETLGIERDKTRKREMKRLRELNEKDIKLDREIIETLEQISSLQIEEAELIEKNLKPQSHAIQLLRLRLEELERKIDLLRTERAEINKERSALLERGRKVNLAFIDWHQQIAAEEKKLLERLISDEKE